MTVRIVGHRGVGRSPGEGGLPENAISSFRAAASLGLDEVELDVRRGAGGAVVAFHDETTDRLCGVPGRVRETPLERLPALLGVGSARAPTLDAIFAAKLGIPLNIEIKREPQDDPAALARDVCAAYRAAGAPAETRFSSFDPEVLAALTRLGVPRARRAFIAERLDRRTREIAARHGAIHLHHAAIDRAVTDFARGFGLRLDAWTVNSMPDAARLVALGVDAIITDTPSALLHAGVRALRRA